MAITIDARFSTRRSLQAQPGPLFSLTRFSEENYIGPAGKLVTAASESLRSGTVKLHWTRWD